METSIPGIFAAGDVTSGGYNSFSRAVAQGMAAGLSAYRYIYHKKFGTYPPLFAYRPTDFPIPSDFEELPPLDEDLLPKPLVDGKEIEASLGRKWVGLSKSLNGKLSIRKMAEKKNVAIEDLKKVLKRLAEKKMITFHIDLIINRPGGNTFRPL
jgi:succinate dehydrogenase/fumarate reductase flavoprotein subunit